MTKQVQRRRGTATQHTSFTGAEGELSVNTTNKTVHVHDGVTTGGIESARADLDNVSAADILSATGITASVAELNRVDGVTSPIQTQLNAKAPTASPTFTGTVTAGDIDITGPTPTLLLTDDDVANESTKIQNSSGNLFIDGRNGDFDGQFIVRGQGGGVITEHFRANANGLGIFNTTPTVALDVTGSAKISGNLTVDTSTLHVDSTNNRVGVGTTSPDVALDVETTGPAALRLTRTNATANYAQFQVGGGNSEQLVIQSNVSNQVGGFTAFEVSGSEAMRIDASGNVGIGTPNPSSFGGTLNVVGAALGGETTLVLSNSSTSQFVRLGINANQAQIAYDNADALVFGQALSSGDAGIATEHMRITLAGSVGIGTTSPSAALEVAGDAKFNGITVGRGAGDVANNTASGRQALFNNTTGNNNTASGRQALFSNTTGSSNTASGRDALRSNTTGGGNTASGHQVLFSNTTGINNTASGYLALSGNTTGGNNTASGYKTLLSNTIGSGNTASGRDALLSNTEGNSNTASGHQALPNNTTGSQNTASGRQALLNNTTGAENTASGFQALQNNTTGSGNTAINPRTSGSVYAPVFNPTTQNDRFCMGSTAVTNAYIQVAWTVVSDKRDKTEMKPVPHGLDFVKELKPTSFRYKADRADTEGHGVTRYGFLAQDILALEGDNPVIIDNEDPEKLRMTDQSLIAVLVNAIQDQQKIIETLEGRITALENN